MIITWDIFSFPGIIRSEDIRYCAPRVSRYYTSDTKPKPTVNDSMNRARFLKSLQSLLEYQRSCGVVHYPQTDALRSGLQALADFAVRRPVDKAALPEPGPPQEPEPPKSEPSAGIDLEELAREISGCRNCDLHTSRKFSTPGRGGAKPQLLIIGEWLVHDHQLQGRELFGAEQDLMLENMIKALRLLPEDVFVTNVIKCSVDRGYHVRKKQLATCMNYCREQIALVRPIVICTMGTVAAQVLLNTDKSLFDLRGTFRRYALADGTAIPVMPTFHPTYLLKNAEMKKPAWQDLQEVRKLLDRSPGRSA